MGSFPGHRDREQLHRPETFAYYKKAQDRYDGLQVVQWPGQGFNFSAINNYGRQSADGEYLLLLNNDVEVINGDWLTELLRQCARPDGAAAAGAMLYYPDDTISTPVSSPDWGLYRPQP